MSIGYACLAMGVPNTNLKNCILKNASQEKLDELISHNLKVLDNLIDYNIINHIKLFRISSDLIPFASNPINGIEWWKVYDNQWKALGKKIKDSGMRVSMHPGQYTVLNSIKDDVVERAIQDLIYHTQVLDSLGVGTEHKIILHIGGVYDDRQLSINRFITNYQLLNDSIKERLVIENDDRSYPIGEVLEIGKKLNIPVIFDSLHHEINHEDHCENGDHGVQVKDEISWINECKNTWKAKDGKQKIHYSQQNPNKKQGSHSSSIKINEFLSFYERLDRSDIDIMLEVKDKNLSAVKCINCTSDRKKVKSLEMEWSRYKYKVLEKSQEDYLKIRKLLVNKKEFSPIPFYNIVEHALDEEDNIPNSVNAALHIWGYFKNNATENEKINFFESIEAFKCGKLSILTIKNRLWKMSVKYNQGYLLDSYYFIL